MHSGPPFTSKARANFSIFSQLIEISQKVVPKRAFGGAQRAYPAILDHRKGEVFAAFGPLPGLNRQGWGDVSERRIGAAGPPSGHLVDQTAERKDAHVAGIDSHDRGLVDRIRKAETDLQGNEACDAGLGRGDGGLDLGQRFGRFRLA